MPKKKKTKARARTQQASLAADAADELLALQAIYGDELEVLPDGKSFSLVIVPHPGDGGVNRVSLRLVLSYPVGYPREALEVKYKDLDGLNLKQAREVLKELKQVAAQQASRDSIAGFDVIQAAQQGLQMLNGSQAGPANDDEPSGSVEEARGGAARDAPVSTAKDVPAEVDDTLDVEPAGPSSFEAFDWAEGRLYLDDLFEAGWEEPEIIDSPPSVVPTAPASSRAPAIKEILPAPPAVQRISEKTSSHAERTARFSEPPASLAESSRTGSMLAGIKSGISALGRALLPAQLRGLMDGEQVSAHDDSVNDLNGDASSSEEAGESKELDRDLLIGHLLTRGTAPTDLPDVLQMLQARRLIPRWVGWLLLNRPDLFEVALHRLADRSQHHRRLDRVSDTSGGGASFSESKSSTPVDVEQFWRRGSLQNKGGVPAATTSAASSRYRSDFVELRPLGRGAFGLVVAATNRMDGRVYAVKRIALDAQTPVAYARIMREVTTLSRLQHPHVVRYFQAWTEEAVASSGGGRGGHHRGGISATETTTVSTLGGERSVSTSASETAAWGYSETDGRSTHRMTLPAVPEASEEGASGEEARASVTSHAREWWEEITSQSTTVVSQSGAATQQRSHQTLYIQMEYCTRTLRDVLDAGPLDDCDRWRVLRQILAGLAYIHDQGIIHRDLKPANIFYDAKGEIKLGDFGLAKLAGSDQASEPVVEASQHDAAAARCGGGAEHTTQVGTSFYISPEIMNGWASYDERVDSYSLGILTFELWHPFSTGMERVILLRDLREHGVMPAEFEAANPAVCRLIHWMLRKNPADRPTARQVLGSDLLPPTVGDEQLNDLLRSLPENPATQQRVVDALFALSDDHGSANALDVAGAPLPIDMSRELGADIRDQESPGAVHVLSARGEHLTLRHELRAAFAGWALRHAALLQDGFVRYELARVVRGGPKHGLSRQAALADLDIVAAPPRDRAEALLPLAEVAALVCSALGAIPSAAEYELRVGHVGLLQLALRHAGVPQELRGGALRLLSTATTTSPRDSAARSARWPAIRAGLEGLGLSPEAAARCRQLLVLGSGEPEVALHWLRATLGHLLTFVGGAANRDERHYASPLDDIEQLLIALEDTGVASSTTSPCVVDALMAPQGDQFSGLLLQWHVKAPASTQTKTTALVAAGGRYDRLLKAVWARQARPGPLLGGAGVTINVDRLVQLTARGNSGEHASSSLISVAASLPGLARLSAAEALVASRGGGGMIRERLALLRTLREAGIAAETLRAAAPSLTAQYDYAASRGIPMLIILHGASYGADNHVHVKCRLCRSEESVPAEEVARYVRQHTRLAHGQRGWNDDVEDERELGWKERERRRRSRPT